MSKIILNTITQNKKHTFQYQAILIGIRGQSNVEGSAQSPVTWLETNHPEVLGLKDNIYIYQKGADLANYEIGVNHNRPGTGNINLNYFGVNPSLLYYLHEYYQVPIYCVQYAIGGTQLRKDTNIIDWNAGSESDMLDNYINSLLDATLHLNTVYGVDNWLFASDCWNQGEEDAENGYTDDYEANELSTINKVRTFMGGNSNFICTGVKKWPVLQPLKQANAEKSPLNHYISNDDLTYDDIATSHYNSQSAWNHGLKFYNKIIELYPKT